MPLRGSGKDKMKATKNQIGLVLVLVALGGMAVLIWAARMKAPNHPEHYSQRLNGSNDPINDPQTYQVFEIVSNEINRPDVRTNK